MPSGSCPAWSKLWLSGGLTWCLYFSKPFTTGLDPGVWPSTEKRTWPQGMQELSASATLVPRSLLSRLDGQVLARVPYLAGPSWGATPESEIRVSPLL